MISINEAIDIGKITLKNFKKDKFELVFEHNDYPFVNKLYRGRDVSEQSGKVISRSITLGKTGNAKFNDPYDVDEDQNVNNIQEEILVPWSHAQTSFSYTRQEANVQGGAHGIVNLIKVRRTNMMNELADLLEEQSMKCPADSSDKKSPTGIPYWLVKGDSDGWTGLNPNYEDGTEITTGAGGIDSDTYSKWANWYASYSTYDDALLQKLSQAFRRTKFKSPQTVKDLKDGGLSNYQIYTNDTVLGNLETLALQSDDQVGFDLGKYAGRTAFKRIPLEYHDILDDANTDTYGTNPIFGINWHYFEPICMKGDRFVVSEPMKDRRQHNVMTVFVDVSYNIVCTNRQRAGFLVSM